MTLQACGRDEYWHGCYKGTWDIWTPESYAHPAKMAATLANRIFEHLEELGLLRLGDTILDPMLGIGTVLLVGATRGHRGIGIELEPKFVALAQANVDRLKAKLPETDITIIQGDSRKLSTLLTERGLVAVTSPPYADIMQTENKGQIDWKKAGRPDRLTGSANRHNVEGTRPSTYGCTPGQIGNLPNRPLKAILSPPYAESQSKGGPNSIPRVGYRGSHMHEQGKNQPDKVGERCGYTADSQGRTEGQIANLPDKPLKAVFSPPFEDMDNDGCRKSPEHYFDQVGGVGHRRTVPYGQSPGQIGNLKCLTSPPYGAARTADSLIPPHDTNLPGRCAYRRDNHGESEGQLANAEDYSSAMLAVYREIAKVADVCAVVVKNPTRAGKLRRLDLTTIELLQASGFHILCHHKAILWEETERQTLFGETVKKDKGRIGFFKRLARRRGAEIAQWENVIVAVNRLEAVPLPMELP